jgi:hypothetical protein
MLADAHTAATQAADGARAIEASGDVISAEQVADAVMRGIKEERFLILPHPEVTEYIQRKAADPDRWLAGCGGCRHMSAPDRSMPGGGSHLAQEPVDAAAWRALTNLLG